MKVVKKKKPEPKKRITKKESDIIKAGKQLNALKKYCIGIIAELGVVLMSEQDNFLLFAKKVELDLKITNNTPLFQPYDADNNYYHSKLNKFTYVILGILDIRLELGTVSKTSGQIRELAEIGTPIYIITPFSDLSHKLQSI